MRIGQLRLAYCIFWLAIAASVAGADEKKIDPGVDESVKITNDRTDGAGFVRTKRKIEAIIKSADGTPEVVGLGITLHYLKLNGSNIIVGDQGPWIQFAPLQRGDIIPAFGRLNRVGDLVVPAKGEPADFFLSSRLTNPINDITLKLDGICIPLVKQQRDCSNLHRRQDCEERVWVESIVAGTDSKPATARIGLEFAGLAAKAAADVRVGDVLMFGDVGHAVSAIVPQNPKTRVIGWVEFDADKLTLAEATRAAETNKANVVRYPDKP